MTTNDIIFFLEAEINCQTLGFSTCFIVQPILRKISSGEVLVTSKAKGRYALYTIINKVSHLIEFVTNDFSQVLIQKVTRLDDKKD